MSSTRRSVRIDLTRDLPPRARLLAPDALSQVFGGGTACFFYRGQGGFTAGYGTNVVHCVWELLIGVDRILHPAVY